MNKKCDIIRDLLPSYIEKVTSDESNKFVEEHIAQCESCEIYLNDMKAEIELPEDVHIEERLNEKKPFKNLSIFSQGQKKFTKLILYIAVGSLLLAIYLLSTSILKFNEFKEDKRYIDVIELEKEAIISDAFNHVDSGEAGLIKVFEKYKKQLNMLAIFPTAEVEDELIDTERNMPTTMYPIDYNKATTVIGANGVIKDKSTITPSGYDLGTVVMANDEWVIQFEYRGTYENTIEKYHQLRYYGPRTWSFFQLPILFFTIFIVLGTVWFFMNKQNRQLQGVI
ncbi:zf-HC2 domain-containing protein [Bacillus suaedaesalsae]|uniref:Zf-HC2 domain-containing protein n=1 Tax=Bacillus suaedaesalsae TaxID=2810349 RepID=A0ABS2DEX4_9BACI|nr:zf-HC2 domain-containing protein [Bacillus suaedaesalsae]MBM6616994.1 zf-HC2 domain-containing protein [Bacillus suaedaesalsae]